MPQAEDGKLAAIGVAERERVALAPNLPTLAEQGLTDFEATIWSGLMAPAGTPQDIVDKLARATDTATRQRRRDRRVVAGHHHARRRARSRSAAILESEIKKWRAVGVAAGMMKLTARALTGSAVSCQAEAGPANDN